MAGQSVVRFILDGSGKAVEQIDKVKKSLLGLNQAKASGGSTGAVSEREQRGRFGKLAKVGQLASGIGPIGQLAEIAGAATPALAALGIAGVAAGFAISQFGKMVNLGIAAIKTDTETRYAAGNKIKAATESADQTALGSTMGQRDKLMGGNPANITPELVKFYAMADKVQSEIDKANVNRALSSGEGVMRSELARTKSPESAAILEMNKAAEESVEIQKEISGKLNFLERFVTVFTNGMQGKSLNQDVIDAQRNLSSVSNAKPR